MPFSKLLFIFLLLLFSPSTPSSSSSNSSIPISLLNTNPHSHPFQKLTYLASNSIARAHHLKNPENAPTSAATPLYPYSGAYSISFSFGTPPQTMAMIMDTGSSFSWFPCTRRYTCKNCSFFSENNISSFIPKQSSSAKILGCKNPKCGWVHRSFEPDSSCSRECQVANQTSCTQICPPYMILYGQGSTAGVAMSEILNLPNEKIHDFLVGCSIFSSNLPAGVAGFGRGNTSLPSQLGLKRFSYCLDTTKSGSLYMDALFDSGEKTAKFSYTPFLKNPVFGPEYYYVGLRKITVGGKKVEIPYENLCLDKTSGGGGTIVDSGSTFTYMNRAVFTAVADEFTVQVKNYEREVNVESRTGLRPCFDVTGEKVIKMPGLKFHFKGGAEMELPLENYFFAASDDRKLVVCLAMVTDNTLLGSEVNGGGGPSVILGNFLMQNFHVEFDLRNERFGFRQRPC
ncbi:eukaryotic aspartyl protease family protein [Striga asiatica]|uniref:Eukaryotic aspartyl protease family protein n=1 Tax=Striga asiatica TaxID=4170 RepID=A0A5A7R5U0_STRAF|nr:eukaryotic aspartyl protease family protein [Striga asiatica]